MEHLSVVMYGAQWCGDCRRSKALLDRLQAPYTYVDLEQDPDGARQAEQISGRQSIPVIAFADGQFLVEPSDAELTDALTVRNLISS